jgi:hypothetical protein
VKDQTTACPFCGGDAHTVYIRDGRMARCTKCGASGPGEFHGPADRLSADERAIAAWNRRASDSAAGATQQDKAIPAVLSPDNAAMVASLVAERDALVEDAERYRWLRDKCGDSFLGVFKHAWDSHHRTWLSGATLDAAIDAARLSAKEPT